MSGKEMPYLIW